MHTLRDMAKALNRTPVYLSGLQRRFALPVFEGAAYSNAYHAFLRALIVLRTFNIGEETLVELWCLEKKLLQLLHVDSAGSPTWFLNACGQTTHSKRRLLLTNYDLGVSIPLRELQLGLNFATKPSELFGGVEMGEDALRVLNSYVTENNRICAALTAELPSVRTATRWLAALLKHKK